MSKNIPQDLIDAVDSDFARGIDSAESVAQEWADYGFDADSAAAWLEARCFDAHSAAELRDAGLTPEQCSATYDGAYVDTIGYAVANGDLSVDLAVKMAVAS